MLLEIVGGAALVVALAAWLRARGLARRIEQLTRSDWELRYQLGELRSQVTRSDPDAQRTGDPASTSPPSESFVPLSTLKR